MTTTREKVPGWQQAIFYVGLSLAALAMLFPFLWMILVALKEPNTAMNLEFLPRSDEGLLTGLRRIYTLSNFTECLFNEEFPFFRFFLNSLVVATVTGVLTTMICTMAGYAFAKKNFLGRDVLFKGMLATMLIPGMIYMIPQFSLIIAFNWSNTWQAMIVPHLSNVFGLYLMRNYIKTIPNSLFEAAQIDGATEIDVLRNVIIPLSGPVKIGRAHV